MTNTIEYHETICNTIPFMSTLGDSESVNVWARLK